MVTGGQIEAKGGAKEIKEEECNAEATTMCRQQCRGADGTSAARRSCAHAMQYCHMTVSLGGQCKSASREIGRAHV